MLDNLQTRVSVGFAGLGERSLPKAAILLALGGATFALAILCGFYSVVVGSDKNWDLFNYHLYNGFAFFSDRLALDVAPAQLQSYINPILDIPFFLLFRAANDHPKLIAFAMGSFHAVNILLSALITWEVLRPYAKRPVEALSYSAVAVAISVTGAGSVGLIGTTTGDLQITPFVLGSIWLFLLGIRRMEDAEATSGHRVSSYSFIMAGSFLAGLAAGLKLTAAIYLLALGAAAIFMPRHQRLRTLVALGCFAGIGIVIGGGYNFAKLYAAFDSPLFPFYNQLLHSPFFEPVDISDARFTPKTTFEALFRPFYWATGSDGIVADVMWFRDIRFAVLWVLLVAVAVGVVVRAKRGARPGSTAAGSRWIFVFAFVAYVVWQRQFSIYRYLIPLEMISGALIVLAVLWLVAGTRLRVAAVATLAIATIATTWPSTMGHVRPIGSKYISVDGVELPPNSMVVVLAGDTATSYLVPFFDPTIAWINLYNNLLDPRSHNRLAALALQRMRSQAGPIYVLERTDDPQSDRDRRVEDVGLERAGACREIVSNPSQGPLAMCVARLRPQI